MGEETIPEDGRKTRGAENVADEHDRDDPESPIDLLDTESLTEDSSESLDRTISKIVRKLKEHHDTDSSFIDIGSGPSVQYINEVVEDVETEGLLRNKVVTSDAVAREVIFNILSLDTATTDRIDRVKDQFVTDLDFEIADESDKHIIFSKGYPPNYEYDEDMWRSDAVILLNLFHELYDVDPSDVDEFDIK